LKKGFSLLFTLIFVMIMAVVGVMILEFSTSSVKHTARSFMDTKAELALRAATEYAIMALQGHDYTHGRINKINLHFPEFDAEVRFHYFTPKCANTDKYCTYEDTNDTNMTSLIYVTVESKNKSFKVRKVRVTLQNP